ncbi:A-kinase anchor protein 1, mitochondrial [Sabethes cyaneus]|uniref:A-kinase anchor protein 1, mitochondrial n=1 Tax=Sabethes cyaneus TaxID=53552 RepID=UPI00237D3852|nr:A-kinase anchor protein 1, mitochondrial [Sabethes cyaneus]
MMVNGRPLLLLTVPGLAIIVGLIWFRRKKFFGLDSGGKKSISECLTMNNCGQKLNPLEDSIMDVKHTDSLPISPVSIKNDPGKHQSVSSSSSCSGKSAPIDIIPNIRSPPKVSDQQFDAELLKLKIEESDMKHLRLIEEQDDYSSFESPVNLPGTADRYQNFIKFNESFKPTPEPVVVKANMTAKISPKSSFATSFNPAQPSEIQFSELENANPSHTADSEQFITSQSNNEYATNNDCLKNNRTNQKQLDKNENSSATSPPLSLCSLHSGDSGKGSSPPQSDCAPATSYEFLLPTYLINRMLGRKANFVQIIKSKTGVNVLIKRNPSTHKTKICSLKGTQADIDNALALIRLKFPEKRFPVLTLQRVDVGEIEKVLSLPLLDTTCIHLQLVEGINNDVSISSIITGGHVFLQQPLHPTFPLLNTMQQCMIQNYNMIEAPLLPEIIENAICVVMVHGSWYRVQIISHNKENQHCLVKYLDYGGFANVAVSSLRQIRANFMGVPFQSIECVLSNVKPYGDSGWLPEASEVLHSLSKGLILQAQVAGYTADGLPEIYLFASLARDNVIFINQELVARNLAVWMD